MKRREFLRTATLGTASVAGAGWLTAGCATGRAPKKEAQAMTVRGPIPAEQLGATLPHEHLLLDFIGADQISRDRYNQDVVFEALLPHVQQVKDLGCDTLVECTAKWLGRDVVLLRRLSKATGLQILTNTGCYGAAQNKFLPRYVFTDSHNDLAARWVAEWQDGIDGTEIRPGFIKIGVDSGRLSDVHRKLVRAAARTHLQSGLTIAAHTGDGVAALDEISTLKDSGVSPRAFIWVHAQNESDEETQLRAAEQGAWIEFDNLSPKDLTKHLNLVQSMKAHGYLGQVLVSHDAGWYEVGKPDGGEFRPFTTMFTDFIPALKKADFTDDEIHRLLVVNPREAFSIRVRSLPS